MNDDKSGCNGLICLFIGIVCLISGVVVGWKSFRLSTAGQTVVSEIVDSRVSYDRRQTTWYTYAFNLNGVRHTAESTCPLTSPPMLDVMPNDPTVFRVHGIHDLTGAWLFLGAGVFACAFGGYQLFRL